MTTAADAFEINTRVWSDIQDHLPLLFQSSRGNVMEIGVRGGASTSALLAGIGKHGGHLWSVDVNPCKIFDDPNWTFIQANSITEKERILAEIPQYLDILFVDGDHSYEGCLSDLETYGPRANMIFVHDCECPDTFPGVRQAFEQFSAKWGKGSMVISGSYGMGVINMCRIQKAKAIPGWMTDAELIWLARQAVKCASIVEIGSYQGHTTRVFGDNTQGHVYAIDDWQGLREEWWTEKTPLRIRENLFQIFSANISDLVDAGTVIPLTCDHAKIHELPAIPCGDLIFIDGDHKHENVKRDIETWLPYLNPGGMICGHDFNLEPVQRAVKELLSGADTAVGLIWKWENK